MAIDVFSRRQGGKDWSCGIGDDSPESGGPSTAVLGAGAFVIGAAIAGVYFASSAGGRSSPSGSRPSTARGAPPTMILAPGKSGYSVNHHARGYFAGGRG